MSSTDDKKTLIEDVKKLKSLGLDKTGLVPISVETNEGIKKPPSWFPWSEYRDGKHPRLTDSDIEEIWGKPDVVKGAIMLDDTCFLIDAEGEGVAMQHILYRRMSDELREKLRDTRVTHTPHGMHILVYLDPRAFPEGIPEMLCWRVDIVAEDGNKNKSKKRRPGEHAPGSGEIRVLSQSKYAIEAGEGYWPIDAEHEVPVELDEKLSKELVNLYTVFKDESGSNLYNGRRLKEGEYYRLL